MKVGAIDIIVCGVGRSALFPVAVSKANPPKRKPDLIRRDHHNEGVFRWYWKAICRAYPKAHHAFERGSSRETLSMWVSQMAGVHVTSAELRMHLEEAARRGWMRMVKTPKGYTKFFMAQGPKR